MSSTRRRNHMIQTKVEQGKKSEYRFWDKHIGCKHRKRILHKWIFWWSIGLALNVLTWLGKRLLPACLSLTLSVIALVFFGISIWSNYWKK